MTERLTYSGTKEAKPNVTIKEVTDKLAHYEDLEEQGRLIELPCKVGDTVWVLNGKFILEYEIDSFAVDEGGAWLMYLRHYEKMRTFCHNKEAKELGKTVFLAREEAEAALKGAEQ